MSRRFCETWESGRWRPKFPGLATTARPGAPPFVLRWRDRCGNVHSSQTHPIGSFYTPMVPEKLHRTYGARDLHFLTFSCYHRQPLLSDPSRRDLLLQILERVRRRYRLVVLGYVVMPEHVHLLVTEPQRSTLSIAMQALKLGFVRSLGGSGIPRSRKIGETRDTPPLSFIFNFAQSFLAGSVLRLQSLD